MKWYVIKSTEKLWLLKSDIFLTILLVCTERQISSWLVAVNLIEVIVRNPLLHICRQKHVLDFLQSTMYSGTGSVTEVDSFL